MIIVHIYGLIYCVIAEQVPQAACAVCSLCLSVSLSLSLCLSLSLSLSLSISLSVSLSVCLSDSDSLCAHGRIRKTIAPDFSRKESREAAKKDWQDDLNRHNKGSLSRFLSLSPSLPPSLPPSLSVCPPPPPPLPVS